MAGNKYVAFVLGKLKEIAGIQTSAGSGDAGKIPALDSGGRLDISMMPTGVTAEVVTCPAYENLSAGNFVNLFSDSGTVKAQKADGTTNSKPAHGFVKANVTAPATATVYLVSGINDAVSGLTPGADYWLSTTPGAVTSTALSASGNLSQHLGIANAAGSLPFQPIHPTVEIA